MKNFLIIICILSISNLFAQDIHLSQIFNAPMLLNPANTGAFEGAYRIGGFYRNQWNSVTIPYQTYGANAELSLFKNAFETSYLGAGVSFVGDKAGDGNYTTNQFAMSVAYHQGLNTDYNHYVSLGFKAGVIQRNVNLSKFYYGSQITATGFDNSLPSGENILFPKLTNSDFAIGVSYFNGVSDDVSITVGGSYHHLKRQNFSFFDNENLTDNLYSRFNFYATFDMSVGDYYKFSPRLFLQKQGPNSEFIPGIQFTRYLSDDDERRQASAGIYWRAKDALIFTAKTTIYDLTIGLSYDVNLSLLTRASRGRGGPEITIEYMGFLSRERTYVRKKVKCPKL